jgi:hypothetical protein
VKVGREDETDEDRETVLFDREERPKTASYLTFV